MKKSRLLIIVSIIIFVVLEKQGISGQNHTVSIKTPLAGNPIYPENEATEWTTIQQDQNLSAEDKIKATINTYFTLKYESWKRGEILDFAFLVDLSDPQASEDYAFERGLLYYLITGWKFWNALLISYDYDLTYNRIEIDGDQAIVMVFPLAQIVHKDTPDKVDPHSWTMHNFSLIKKTDRWLIKSIDVKDENHDIYPQGTNFNEFAETFAERQEEFLIEQENGRNERQNEDINFDSISDWVPFNDLACRAYAIQYTSNGGGYDYYNHLFYHWECNDCQNFVSQCLWAGYGGINLEYAIENHLEPMINNSNYIRTWWCDSEGAGYFHSWSWDPEIKKWYWINVSDFTSMLYYNWSEQKPGLRGIKNNVIINFGIGDMVKTGDSSHMMIICTIRDDNHDYVTQFGEIYICAHTNDRLDYRLYDLNPDVTCWTFYQNLGYVKIGEDDSDGDGILSRYENMDPNGDGDLSDAQDTDNDTIPDFLDYDDDGDLIPTIEENPDPNGDGEPSDGQNTDGDLFPDYLDDDDDGDGIPTFWEIDTQFGSTNNTSDKVIKIDTDSDGIFDYLDDDDDGDGVKTYNENPDPNGDGNPEDAFDTDGDGIPDYLDRESINWGTLEQLTYTNVSNIYPDICIDSADIIHLVWQKEIGGDYEIFYKKSTDKGLSWSSPLQLTYTPGNIFNSIITSDSGSNLYLVWQAEDPGDYSVDIYFKKSTDKGDSWSTPTRLTWNQKYSFSPIIRTDSDDNIHLVYSYNNYICTEIYYKKSTDGGSTWSNPTRLTWLSGGSWVRSLTVDSNSNLYISWIDDTPGETEIYYKKSTDGGDDWTGATRLTWTNSYCRNTFMKTDMNNNVHIVWDNNSSGNHELYYRKSTDCAETWSALTRLTYTSGNSFNSNFSFASNDNVYIVFQDNTPGGYEVYSKRKINMGTVWTCVFRETWGDGFSDISNPKILLDSDENFHLVWYGNKSGNNEIYYRKGVIY